MASPLCRRGPHRSPAAPWYSCFGGQGGATTGSDLLGALRRRGSSQPLPFRGILGGLLSFSQRQPCPAATAVEAASCRVRLRVEKDSLIARGHRFLWALQIHERISNRAPQLIDLRVMWIQFDG